LPTSNSRGSVVPRRTLRSATSRSDPSTCVRMIACSSLIGLRTATHAFNYSTNKNSPYAKYSYNAKGEWVQSWGGGGKEPGRMNCPHGIWCDTRDPNNPVIVVADRSNVRLQFFTMDGKFIKIVKDELRAPCHFDQQGTDLLIPDLHGRVTIFDKDNKLITHLCDNPDPAKRGNHGVKPDELKPGQFCTPHGAHGRVTIDAVLALPGQIHPSQHRDMPDACATAQLI